MGNSALSGMPPANEITDAPASDGVPSVRRRSSSAAAVRALRESSDVQSMGAGARAMVRAAGRAGGSPATNVPCPT